MPTYDVRCTTYGCARFERDMELFESMSRRASMVCPSCGQAVQRVYREMQFIGAEFKSGTAFDPVKRRDVKVHGGHFDLGLGAYVNDKHDRERIMKAKGLRPMDPAEYRPHVDTDYAIAYHKRIKHT